MVPKKTYCFGSPISGSRVLGRKWVEIVHGVNLTLHKGEVLGLIGESGAANRPSASPPWALPATLPDSGGRSSSTAWN